MTTRFVSGNTDPTLLKQSSESRVWPAKLHVQQQVWNTYSLELKRTPVYTLQPGIAILGRVWEYRHAKLALHECNYQPLHWQQHAGWLSLAIQTEATG